MPHQFDRKKTSKNIRLILDKIKTAADPHLLNEYRSLFKKEVSLFRRSWAAAYLLLLYDQGALDPAGRHDKNRSRKSDDPGRRADRLDRESKRRSRNGPDEGGRTEKTPYPLADEDSRRLFFSIGRNRRVFPREILGLINAKTSIPKEDIGAIRILDNYSFVQVRDTVADTIIEALNGQPFRGRILAVSYARTRKEGGEGPGGEDQDGVGLAAEAQDEPESAGNGDWEGAEYRETGAPADSEEAGYSGEDFDEGAEAPDEAAGLPEQDEDHPDKKEI